MKADIKPALNLKDNANEIQTLLEGSKILKAILIDWMINLFIEKEGVIHRIEIDIDEADSDYAVFVVQVWENGKP